MGLGLMLRRSVLKYKRGYCAWWDDVVGGAEEVRQRDKEYQLSLGVLSWPESKPGPDSWVNITRAIPF